MNIDPSSLMPVDAILPIDRSAPFAINTIDTGYRATEYVIASEDPTALALASIDLSKVVITDILDILQGEAAKVNEILAQNIARIKSEGGVFLDAKVLGALLANPKLIPIGWESFADADGANTADIEFIGTTLQEIATGELQYFRLGFNRGVWSYHYTPTTYSDEQIASFAEYPTVRLRRLAAVLMK